ncbi:hypothetical protein Tco_0739880 [Tanacetum coccineum]
MPSRDGINLIDSKDDSCISLTIIYYDSGISLATRVFMMLKMSLVRSEFLQVVNELLESISLDLSFNGNSLAEGVSRTITVVEILKVVTKVLAQEEHNLLLRNTITKKHPHARWKSCQKVKPWVYEETDLFTPCILYFDLPKRTRIPSHVKTYDESEDPEDHLKIFQAVEKVERWAMPTWCHMFNSTLTGSARVWFDDLPLESVDSYDDIKEAFLANFYQQKNASKILWKSTISSREKEILWRISYVDSRLKAGM